MRDMLRVQTSAGQPATPVKGTALADGRAIMHVAQGGTTKDPDSLHRSVSAADVIAAPTITSTAVATGVGALTAGTYKIKVVAVNIYGRTTATAGSDVVTTGANLGAIITLPTVEATYGAALTNPLGKPLYYDIYCSTDADPKFVGRVLASAVEATGWILDGSNGGDGQAGSNANTIRVYAIGTGLKAGTTAAVNTAYKIPEIDDLNNYLLDATGYQYLDLDTELNFGGDTVTPELVFITFLKNAYQSYWYQASSATVTFGGTAAAYNSNRQRFRVEVRGNPDVRILVAKMAGFSNVRFIPTLS